MRDGGVCDDGWGVLGSPSMGRLLQAVLAGDGGRLVSWTLDQVDRLPGEATTAAYLVLAEWPLHDGGTRTDEELIGVTARAGGPDESDRIARVFTEQGREVVAWRYPHDPELPGLRTAAFASAVAGLLVERQLAPPDLGRDDVVLQMVTYRPRRRAVVRADLPRYGLTYYLKAMRPSRVTMTLERYRMLRDHGIPVADIVATTSDAVIVMPALPGRPLASALFDPQPPVHGQQIVDLLDALPGSIRSLPRRRPWADHVAHFADVAASALPGERPRLQWMVQTISSGLAGIPPGDEAIHGDFYEAQVFVGDGRITGLLDIDTIGPGRRADDLGCLLAHLSTVQGMDATQADRLRRLIDAWLPVFDHRVDPIELRLRAAAVSISLATGPFRGQERDWPATTRRILDAAEGWITQASRMSPLR
ncbi:hypothetical protein GCM10009785_04810 [Brooklawnia cerclae]|uniref:Aminoglycoside phosphotransferase domain-containing protein n=1 Tax=Brooklawnia cerclae TaxID=349934 RepID=A0ABX0SGW0_9ACTN|nr:phosphotransferase [Brooklawnia cerclae]NIH55927.1 hypothetical protein [Brooklawnia cerclae]